MYQRNIFLNEYYDVLNAMNIDRITDESFLNKTQRKVSSKIKIKHFDCLFLLFTHLHSRPIYLILCTVHLYSLPFPLHLWASKFKFLFSL